ncbi:hypothetical protein B0H15DRAFT_803347 [Mycena belliarum]|uniref:Uncharacterized protein n=1 Tax=Mycena belliarum TaxID=1033014 RepID=A0AAD6U266_9AGAR|nr:hypothetical protein B0H15DRAFT_803347 [Mycena belliae]
MLSTSRADAQTGGAKTQGGSRDKHGCSSGTEIHHPVPAGLHTPSTVLLAASHPSASLPACRKHPCRPPPVHLRSARTAPTIRRALAPQALCLAQLSLCPSHPRRPAPLRTSRACHPRFETSTNGNLGAIGRVRAVRRRGGDPAPTPLLACARRRVAGSSGSGSRGGPSVPWCTTVQPGRRRGVCVVPGLDVLGGAVLPGVWLPGHRCRRWWLWPTCRARRGTRESAGCCVRAARGRRRRRRRLSPCARVFVDRYPRATPGSAIAPSLPGSTQLTRLHPPRMTVCRAREYRRRALCAVYRLRAARPPTRVSKACRRCKCGARRDWLAWTVRGSLSRRATASRVCTTPRGFAGASARAACFIFARTWGHADPPEGEMSPSLARCRWPATGSETRGTRECSPADEGSRRRGPPLVPRAHAVCDLARELEAQCVVDVLRGTRDSQR